MEAGGADKPGVYAGDGATGGTGAGAPTPIETDPGDPEGADIPGVWIAKGGKAEVGALEKTGWKPEEEKPGAGLRPGADGTTEGDEATGAKVCPYVIIERGKGDPTREE